MAGVAVGHPLEVVKTRMQAAESPFRSLSPYQVFRTTVRNEGWRALFRGLFPPLVAITFYQSTLFASYEWSLAILKGTVAASDSIARTTAGLIAGACAVTVAMPLDSLKVRLQLERDTMTGPIRDTVRHARIAVREQGVVSLYRGISANLARDVPTNAIYFVAYANAKDVLSSCLGSDRQGERRRSVATELLAGGFAGSASWAASVPMDVVKTTMQEASASGKSLGFLEAVAGVRRRDGMQGFFRGFAPIVVRAFPVHATIFLTYDLLKRALGAPGLQ
eukprot:gnl/TRDRNA2_/TRDRNA2_82871_c0_seq2.p1 gnl/TRDRNA2_/TRDRNA2_82871_c0~~gnl/TRDRNA2_/TRDRNA2_82871_c0_seq2.p1  ORF type:complete len:289 (+),score=25.87 gnl/TRDRNA2_/TRDRNA2_82871_c0_seq2:36-869(+)